MVKISNIEQWFYEVILGLRIKRAIKALNFILFLFIVKEVVNEKTKEVLKAKADKLGTEGLKAIIFYYSKKLAGIEKENDYRLTLCVIKTLIDALPEEDRSPMLRNVYNSNYRKFPLYFNEIILAMPESGYRNAYLNEYVNTSINLFTDRDSKAVVNLIERIKRPLTEDELKLILEKSISRGNLMRAMEIANNFMHSILTDYELEKIMSPHLTGKNHNTYQADNAFVPVFLEGSDPRTYEYAIRQSLKALDLIQSGDLQKLQQHNIFACFSQVIINEIKNSRELSFPKKTFTVIMKYFANHESDFIKILEESVEK